MIDHADPATEPAAVVAPQVAAPVAEVPEVAPVAGAESEPVALPGTDAAPRIGRYLLSELAAMRGKRGRKPPEFYTAFPDVAGAATAPRPAKTPKVRAARLPHVSSAIIGEHSIDELLAMIGTTGRKPVAYDILQTAAQVFADAGVLALPEPEVDPLAKALSVASPAMRELVAELLRQAPARRGRPARA